MFYIRENAFLSRQPVTAASTSLIPITYLFLGTILHTKKPLYFSFLPNVIQLTGDKRAEWFLLIALELPTKYIEVAQALSPKNL